MEEMISGNERLNTFDGRTININDMLEVYCENDKNYRIYLII